MSSLYKGVRRHATRSSLQLLRRVNATPRCANVPQTLATGNTYRGHSTSSRSIRNASQSGRSIGASLAAVLFLGIATASSLWTNPVSFHNAPATASEEGEVNGITFEEVQKHKDADDCWVIINGMVYDITNFLALHPGGAQAILAEAGKDVSRLFSMMHAPDALETLPAEYCVGPVDPATLPAEDEDLSEEEMARIAAREEMPDTDAFLLLSDFEMWAERVLSTAAWAYYRSAADHEATFHENKDAFKRYFFRPRILRDMSHGDTTTSVVGIPTSIPVMISPAALAKLGHPEGEVNLTKAAGTAGAIQIISANASCSLEEIFDARTDDQPLFYQVYLNKDREQSAKVIQKAERLGAKAIVFTVDVMMQTKRTLDVRTKNAAKAPSTLPKSGGKVQSQRSVSDSISGYQDWNLTWDDVGFIRRNTNLPLIVKGVQSAEDVQLCVNHGVEGVILSNHGGRQADYAPAPIDVLYELRVTQPDLFGKIDVMIDGGIRSGADVVKALALGAKAVGLGRPFLYANGTHGEQGASRVLEILHEEITNTMRNIGANQVKDLKPSMVGPAGPWVGNTRLPYVN